MEPPKPPFKLTSIACFFLLLFTTIIQSFYARTLGVLPLPPPPLPPPRHRHHHHKTMSFYMPNMLNSSLLQPQSTPPNTKVNGQSIPFSKPLGLFPPVGGIPVYDSNPLPGQTPGFFGIGSGMSFSASAIIQEELEFGTVNVIDVDLLEKTNLYGLTSCGKAKGLYVASSEDGSGQMIAMTTSFTENEFRDELKFFGIHQTDINSESHVAVIGGRGKYEGANGYATIKVANLSLKTVKDNKESNNFLLIDVYLG